MLLLILGREMDKGKYYDLLLMDNDSVLCSYDESMFRQWHKKKDRILGENGSLKRIPGGGRKPQLGELEDILCQEIKDMKSNNQRISRKMIAERAKSLAEATNIRLRASPHWVMLFLQRHQLHVTTKRKSPTESLNITTPASQSSLKTEK